MKYLIYMNRVFRAAQQKWARSTFGIMRYRSRSTAPRFRGSYPSPRANIKRHRCSRSSRERFSRVLSPSASLLFDKASFESSFIPTALCVLALLAVITLMHGVGCRGRRKMEKQREVKVSAGERVGKSYRTRRVFEVGWPFLAGWQKRTTSR